MSELKELIEQYIELEENFDEENAEEAEKLHDLGHEIDHAVYHEEFTIIYNSASEDEEVVVLIVGDEEDEDAEFFVVPVYTDEEEAAKAIEAFKEEYGDDIEFLTDKANGNAIVQAYSEDEEFVGLAINAPQCDFLVASENVHDCSD